MALVGRLCDTVAKASREQTLAKNLVTIARDAWSIYQRLRIGAIGDNILADMNCARLAPRPKTESAYRFLHLLPSIPLSYFVMTISNTNTLNKRPQKLQYWLSFSQETS
jgi:hypothetical protein